jgi:putative tryptophan/tyrosine transport system substrate-binding protein
MGENGGSVRLVEVLVEAQARRGTREEARERGLSHRERIAPPASERADAVVVLSSPLIFGQRSQIADLALKARLPTISLFTLFPRSGGLMAYGPNFPDMWKRAATYVERILKGAKAGALPIERPSKFELVINLKTAKALGLDVPWFLQQRADEVIE